MSKTLEDHGKFKAWNAWSSNVLLILENACRYFSIELLLQTEIFEECDRMAEKRAHQKPPARKLKKKGRSDDQFNNGMDTFLEASKIKKNLILGGRSKKVNFIIKLIVRSTFFL